MKVVQRDPSGTLLMFMAQLVLVLTLLQTQINLHKLHIMEMVVDILSKFQDSICLRFYSFSSRLSDFDDVKSNMLIRLWQTELTEYYFHK